MIQEGLVSLLKSADVVASTCSGRIYPVVLPKAAKYPAITYQDISSSSQMLLQGEGQITKRIQFDCWGATYSDVKKLQAALKSVVANCAGALPDGTVVQTVVSDTELDFFENDPLLYRTTNDFIFIGNNL